MSKTRNWHTRAMYIIIALAMTLGLFLMPATAIGQGGTLDVTLSPKGTDEEPVRGELTIAADYAGTGTPNRVDIDIPIPTMYRENTHVLGQTPVEPPTPYVLKATFGIGADPTAGWNDEQKELAREIGFISAAYDSINMKWTIKINTQKKVEVCDRILMELGWWPGQEVWFDGSYSASFTVFDAAGNKLASMGLTYVIFDNPEDITPELSLDAKGAQQKFWLNWIDRVWKKVEPGVPGVWKSVPVEQACLDPSDGGIGGWLWAFDGGVNLDSWGDAASPYDVKIIAGGRPYQDTGGVWHPAECEEDICLPDRFIEIQARATQLGDCEVAVFTCTLPSKCNGDPEVTCIPEYRCAEVASAEKKWGELAFSKLDVHIEDAMPGDNWTDVKYAVEADFGLGLVDNFAKWTPTDHDIEVQAGTSTKPVYEKIGEWVWCDFLELREPHPAGGAVIHWWLAKDTTANQAWIQDLMNDIVNRAEDQGGRGHNLTGPDSNDYWSATGEYDALNYTVDKIMAWIDPPGTANDKFATNTTLDGFEPDCLCDPYICKDPPPAHIGAIPFINIGRWYGRSLTMDYHLNEIPGVSIADLRNTGGEDVLIITFVEYQQDYNAENLVLIQIGKKHFKEIPVIPPAEVKTPQLRWAGEKIVLEKDWSDLLFEEDLTFLSDSGYDGGHYEVQYNLELGSVGTLHPVDDPWDSRGAMQVVVHIDEEHPISRCILESEVSGEADIDAALYWCETFGKGIRKVECSLVHEMGFLVYFLEFEDVKLARNITPWDSLTGLVPEKEAANVTVQVRGFFDYNHSHLDATTRNETGIDLNGDHIADKWLPKGRYVLPDDWWLIAETTNIALRPNYDLMDKPDDKITSKNELGPYDSKVRTTDPPGKAEYPTIGPFSTLQQWSATDMWIARATVPADFKVAAPYTWPRDDADVRNTVVPDGFINEWDAPMPQALVIFNVINSTEPATLSQLLKGDLKGYGYLGSPKVYQSPYYAVEIPANWQIPIGYNWNSWGKDGPYDFWKDLQLKSIISDTHEDPMDLDRSDVEVYSDNHGIAGVTVDALDEMGLVTITATAEYPYTYKRGKYGPRVSEYIPIIWGPKMVHLDADFAYVPVSGPAPLSVTFNPTPWTVGGTAPYVKLVWDFGDGSTKTVTGNFTLATLPSITHNYTADGIYTVSVTITDSTLPPIGPMIDTCEKLGIITVGGGVPPPTTITWHYAIGGVPLSSPHPNPLYGRPALTKSVACANITPSAGAELWGIYYRAELGPEAGILKFYIPGLTISKLTQLVPGEIYYVVVSGACNLTIPQ